MKLGLVSAASLALAFTFVADAPSANACGGCFIPPTENTVVTDHRMALSVSPTQTVLWDQIRYAGDPREFAWVLPVRQGAKLELSRDQWFAALDASTQTVIRGPNRFAGGYGCALTGCGSSDSAGTSSAPGQGQVQVVSQSVVGPYETVTLRATDPNALTRWLQEHAFAIPNAIAPVIDAYVREGFDFLALRLRPGCGERAMLPVRVVSPGADPTLPLRMVAAGVGARVGVLLYVISEGRYEARNFPNAKIDFSKLTWDRTDNRSNYEQLAQDAMDSNNGRSWITEYANRPQIFPTDAYYSDTTHNDSARAGTPGLYDAYLGLCVGRRPPYASSGATPAGSGSAGQPAPCVSVPPQDAGTTTTHDAGTTTTDAGTSDASADASGDASGDAATNDDAEALEAGADAGNSPDDDGGLEPPAYDSGVYTPPVACEGYDDLQVALRGLHTENVWITRLRAILPADALTTGDLQLQPTLPQTAVTNYHVTDTYSDEVQNNRRGCASAPKEHATYGSWALGSVAALFGVAALRRRKRR